MNHQNNNLIKTKRKQNILNFSSQLLLIKLKTKEYLWKTL